MKVEKLVEIIGADFYTGVPDSQLKALCDYLINKYGIDRNHHVIAANEGNCVALAAGYYLATGKVPVVYMQNSGEGNIINPLASLLNEKVYAIPMVFIIGWRGEPGVHDEPQHLFQGEITLKLLDVMGVEYFVVDQDTSEEELADRMKDYKTLLSQGKDVAFVIKKGALSFWGRVNYSNTNVMKREEVLEHVVEYSGEDPIVCTTGKACRELFEIRERNGQSHKYDFLTVGSMGHSSSIALGIALSKPDTKVWCIDGDGAALMHLGAMAVIGSNRPQNLIHIVINNEAHETVGGMPTVAASVNLVEIARGCGYPDAVRVENFEDLDNALEKADRTEGLMFIEVASSIGARKDLGRPTRSPIDNKLEFEKHIE